MKGFHFRWWWALLSLPVILIVGFMVWAYTPPAPMPEALAVMQSDARVKVEASSTVTFTPADGQPTTGLIFYPGGRVDPRAYAPAAHAIAEMGYFVAIVPMPLNLAFFAPDSALGVIEQNPSIQHWVIGGHSLGGAMAARFASTHPNAVGGLALWAAYPDSGDDLSESDLQVVSIYGTRDGLVTADKIGDSRRLLPRSTRWVAIEGGNHAQFGWYGSQSGDNDATIDRLEQQAQTIRAVLRLLESVSDGS